jgi:homoserine kinase type II
MLQPLDIAKVLTFYDLGTLQSVVRALHGYVNETAFVQTSKGCFVVRRNHRRHSPEGHYQRHALIKWLCARNFPAPALIPTREGETLLTLDGRTYEVMECVNGGEFSPGQPGQVANIAKTLARYHLTVRDFASPPEAYTPRYSPQSILSLTELMLERDMMGDLQEPLSWYDRRAAHIRSRTFETSYHTLPHLLIHGDMHRDNLLFSGEAVTALLDFDQATWDARIVDIADALIAFATSSKNETNLMWGMFQGTLDEDRANEFIAAYASVWALTHSEISTLPTIIELLWLQGELGRVVSTPEGAPDYHESVLSQGRWLSGWLNERRERMVARWAKLNVGPTAPAAPVPTSAPVATPPAPSRVMIPAA